MRDKVVNLHGLSDEKQLQEEHPQLLSPPKDHDIVFNTLGVYFAEEAVKKELQYLVA